MNLDRVIAVRNSKTIYRDGCYCIKVFDEGYSKSDVLNEALNQARVEETGLNIPKVIYVTTVEGKWAIVSEYIKGKTMAQLIEEYPDKKSEYLSQLVDIQFNVLSKSCPMLNMLRDKMNRRIYEAELDAITRYDLHTRLEKMPKHYKLCHGDMNPSNIIICDDGTSYILDWAHAAQGNASADAACTYLQLRFNGDNESAEMYLDLFCRKSNTDKENIRKWLPITAASQSVSCGVKEREFLLSLTDGSYNK